ncbi:hypothetical protein IF2G_05223 [Cordyceps javanica]|nr:hypothetical protein IF2G_05223 [Cordyceps javanica]
MHGCSSPKAGAKGLLSRIRSKAWNGAGSAGTHARNGIAPPSGRCRGMGGHAEVFLLKDGLGKGKHWKKMWRRWTVEMMVYAKRIKASLRACSLKSLRIAMDLVAHSSFPCTFSLLSYSCAVASCFFFGLQGANGQSLMALDQPECGAMMEAFCQRILPWGA